MRIVDQLPSGISTPRRGVGASPYGTPFHISSSEAPMREAAVTGRLPGIDSLQGLMALQEVSLPVTLRRQKSTKRGFRLLDALGGLRTGLLAGKLDETALTMLHQGLDEAKENNDDPALDQILNAIETRAAVELAKLGR
jgi:hypothetical protein